MSKISNVKENPNRPFDVPVGWTREEDDFIRGAWGNMSMTKIGKFLERNRNVVLARAKLLGISS